MHGKTSILLKNGIIKIMLWYKNSHRNDMKFANRDTTYCCSEKV